MVKEEKVVAVVDPTSAAGETELMNEVSEIERFADSIVVENDDDFLKAGEFGVLLKTKMAEVTEFFAPMKSAAHAAHKQICDREKQMLRPLKNAETTVKNTLGKYTHEKMLAQKAAEEEARRLAQEEAEKRLEEAVKAEQLGDHDKAQFALLDAEIAEMESKSIVVQSEDRKVKGVSVQKEWEITSIDESAVPTSVNGVCIRPVDTAAVMKLIRSSKGAIKIEGITYQEKTKIGFRRS